jgi:hypothetical protein
LELFVYKGSDGGWIDDGAGAVRNRFELRSEICGMERGGDAASRLPAGTRTGVVLAIRRRVGSSFLGGGVRGGRYLGGGSFLLGGCGTAVVTSSDTGAVLVCDRWAELWRLLLVLVREWAPSEVDRWELVEEAVYKLGLPELQEKTVRLQGLETHSEVG